MSANRSDAEATSAEAARAEVTTPKAVRPGDGQTVVGRLTISMIGTRGVPAQYGGFETAVEEVGARLAADVGAPSETKSYEPSLP